MGSKAEMTIKRYNPEVNALLADRAGRLQKYRARMVRADKGRWCRMQDVRLLIAERDLLLKVMEAALVSINEMDFEYNHQDGHLITELPRAIEAWEKREK